MALVAPPFTFQETTSLLPLAEIYPGGNPVSIQKELFYARTTRDALTALAGRNYAAFDAHTTTNCCHGLSIYAQQIINTARTLDIQGLLKKAAIYIQELENISSLDNQDLWKIPSILIQLIRLYTLAYAKEFDPTKGNRTKDQQLRKISAISSAFCTHLIQYLQKEISNYIALSYQHYHTALPQEMRINEISVDIWGKHIQPNYLKQSKRGILYASNLFSMEIALAYLMYTHANIAVLIDSTTDSGQLIDRSIVVLRGDGTRFTLLSSKESKELEEAEDEPLIVFGGCRRSLQNDPQAFSYLFRYISEAFERLVLACDIDYPDFPRGLEEPSFSDTSITFNEPEIAQKIKIAKIPGTSIQEPFFFCLAHIFPASSKQVFAVIRHKDLSALPFTNLPACKACH